MWEIKPRGSIESPALQYQEARFADLPSSDSSPVQFLGRALGVATDPISEKSASALSELEKAIPTWLRLKHEGIDSDVLIRLANDPSEWTSAIAVRIPDSEENSGYVWIDQNFVLVWKPAKLTDLEVEYTVSDEDHARTLRLETELGGPSTATLEWYATIGTNTTVLSGESTFQGPGRVKRALLQLSEKAGWLLGRVVRHRIASHSRPTTDPLWERRKRDLETRQPALANSVPDFRHYVEGSSQDDKATDLIVLVHGTLSCGMRMAAALKESNLGPRHNSRWVRYEHDTFLPITDNASELMDLTFRVEHRFKRILFICHSRGGLVGVTAMGSLANPLELMNHGHILIRRRHQQSQIEVCTFGTPHRGTPIAAGAESISTVLRAIGKSSSRMAFTSLGLDPVGWAAGWAIGRISFPHGIAEMSPRSSFVSMYGIMYRNFPVAVAGGYFDPTDDADGYFAVAKQSALAEIMDGEEHDGVVPLQSCLGIGELLCEPARQCGHSDYFSREDTLFLLRRRLKTGRW